MLLDPIKLFSAVLMGVFLAILVSLLVKAAVAGDWAIVTCGSIATACAAGLAWDLLRD